MTTEERNLLTALASAMVEVLRSPHLEPTNGPDAALMRDQLNAVRFAWAQLR